MTVRRRSDDDDWNGARQRTPWDGPTSQWGEDVNTRLDSQQLGLERVEDKVDKLTESLAEPLRIFRHSKKVGLAAVALIAFLGWSGVQQIWGWIRSLIGVR